MHKRWKNRSVFAAENDKFFFWWGGKILYININNNRSWSKKIKIAIWEKSKIKNTSQTSMAGLRNMAESEGGTNWDLS